MNANPQIAECKAAPGNDVRNNNVRWQDINNSQTHHHGRPNTAMEGGRSAHYDSGCQSMAALQQQSYSNAAGRQQNVVNDPYGQQQLSNALQGMQLGPESGRDSIQQDAAASFQKFQHEQQQSHQQSCRNRMSPVTNGERMEKQWRPSSAVQHQHTTPGAGGYPTSVSNVTDQKTQCMVSKDMAIQTRESMHHVGPTASGPGDSLTSEERKYGVTFKDGVLPKPIWHCLESAETAKDRMRQ